MNKEVFDFSGVEGLEKLQEASQFRETVDKNYRDALRAYNMLNYVVALEGTVSQIEGQITFFKCAIERAEKSLAQFKKDVPEILSGKTVDAYTGKLSEEQCVKPLGRDATGNVAGVLKKIWRELTGLSDGLREKGVIEGWNFEAGSLLAEIQSADKGVATSIRDLKADAEMDR